MLILVFPFYVVSKYAGNYMLMLLSCFTITYLFHGWIGAYFNIVFYSMILVFISKIRIFRKRAYSEVSAESF